MLSDLRYRFRAMFLRDAVEAELDEELRFHFDHQLEKYERAGLSHREALRRVRFDFGGADQVREECRDARGTRWLEDALQDLKHAARTLRKYPVFAAAVMITVGLGVGASTAMFSVTDGVLMRPLPYPGADRLVLAARDMPRRNIRDYPMSTADYLDVHNELAAAFEDSAAAEASTQDAVLPRPDGTPAQVRIETVTPNFLHLLGAKMALGHDFDNAANQDGAPLPAVLSYEFWKRHYRSDASVLGRPIRDHGAVITGVLAPGFELLLPPSYNVARAPDVWIGSPLNMESAPRTVGHLRAIAKLRGGVALEEAQRRADAVAAEFERKFPVKKGSGVVIRLEPMRRYLAAEARPAILTLLGAALFLLLIACANGANLLLVRTSLRQREFAVRASLGGSRLRILRQMLTEGAAISAAGTLLGILIASAALRELAAIAPRNPDLSSMPRLDQVSFDLHSLAFCIAAGLFATLIFGLIPALRIFRRDLGQILRAGVSFPDSKTGVRFRNVVVTTEIALSVVMLVASGLLFRSYIALQHVYPGYDPRGILTFRLTGFRGRPGEGAEFVRKVRSRLSAMPGIHAVTAARSLPLNGVFYALRWGGEAALTDPKKSADFQVVLPGYFETLRTPVIAGRTFTEDDDAPGKNVAIIDEQFAAKAFPHQSPVGKQILVSVRAPSPEWVRIIGVVAHQRDTSLAKSGREQIYLTSGFLGNQLLEQWAVQIDGDSVSWADTIRSELSKLSRNLLVSEMQPMERFVERAQSGTRFSLLLLTVFAVVAVLLAAIGLYGVLSTVVQQRTAELGIRIALGAAPSGIFQLVVGKGLLLSVIGIALGLAIACVLTPMLETMLVGVKPTDPATLGTVALFFLLLTALASWVPARRAAGVHPSEALREQ